MDTQTTTYNEVDQRLALEQIIQQGRKRLEQISMDETARLMQESVARAKAWNAYNDLLIAALPEVLRPYAVRFSDPYSGPDMAAYSDKISVEAKEAGMAPFLVYLERKSHNLPFTITCYMVPGIEHYTDEDGRNCLTWLWSPKELGYENVDALKTTELPLALALAFEHNAQMNRIEEKLAWVDCKKESPPPLGEASFPIEYIPYENGELPQVAEKALVASIRTIVREEMFKPPQS